MKALIAMATDLTAVLSEKDRYQRFLESVNRIIPYDTAALLHLKNDILIPVATKGLSLDALNRQFICEDYPRFNIICQSKEPVRFEANSLPPDPFDGLLDVKKNISQKIQSSLGCSLISNNMLIGVLTADAIDPHAFDDLDQSVLKAVVSLATAQLQTINLIETLEPSAEQQSRVTSDLTRDIQMQRGNVIIGNSRAIQNLKQEIMLVAESDFNILVLGETGVGKELVVRAIHNASKRKDGPMLYLNCAALPESLAESELFGHKKGAFTGADRDRAGKFEAADGGTLFLDEIGELSMPAQTKLLRVIQEGEIQRIGSDKTIHVDVRLLAATNRNLWVEVKNQRFRADLFHRLDVYPINVPTLRERPEDIPVLVDHFCNSIQRNLGLGSVCLTGNIMKVLDSYLWPGNIRELENMLSRAILKASAGVHKGQQVNVRPEHLGDFVARNTETELTPNHESILPLQSETSLRNATRDFQKQQIKMALHKNNGNWSAAARDLGMHRSNLHNLAKRLKFTNN